MTANKLKIAYWKGEQYFFLLKSKISPLPSHLMYQKKPEVDVIVSLTSYPRRFNSLFTNLKSLLRQSVRPKKIILWIAEEDFKYLPNNIIKLSNTYIGFDIKSCSDMRSYKKIIPALDALPNENIVVCDDDIFYQSNWLKSLFEAWDQSPRQIVAHRVHQITFSSCRKPQPYRKWIYFPDPDMRSENLFPTGMGGVLYPSNCFMESVKDSKKFMHLCPYADDIWLYWMAKLNGCEIRFSGANINFVGLPGTDKGGLAETNVDENGNDGQVANMLAVYGWWE